MGQRVTSRSRWTLELMQKLFLHDLPECLLRSSFLVYLSFRDVCLLDTALTNKAMRSIFLQALNRFQATPSSCLSFEVLLWISRRNMVIKDAFIGRNIYQTTIAVLKSILIEKSITLVGVYGQFELDYCNSMARELMSSKKDITSPVETIDLRRCMYITDSAVVELLYRTSALSHIRFNDSTETIITDASIFVLSTHCQKLKSLQLRYNRYITDSSIIALSNNCLNLEYVDLCQCLYITDDSVNALAMNCKALIGLELDGCLSITDQSLLNLSKYCHTLETLNVNGCRRITDVGIAELATDFSINGFIPNNQITHLYLESCTKITNFAIENIAHGCPALQSINLDCCIQISSVVSLARYSKNLRELSLVACENITDKSLLALSYYARKLERIDLLFCIKLTDYSVQDFRRHVCTQIHIHGP
eukprot:gene10130-21127_t